MTKGVNLEKARAAKRNASDVFRNLVGEEVAVGLTKLDDQSFGLKINLETAPNLNLQMPQEVDGVPIQIEVVGAIRKLDSEASTESVPETEDASVSEENSDSDGESEPDEEDESEPPAAGVDEYFLILHDWFDEATIRERPELATEISEFLVELKSVHPNSNTYDFLPLVGIHADENLLNELKASHLVRWVIQPRYAFEYYSRILDALSALRSQTGDQAFQFRRWVLDGGTLPDFRWEGGQWPARAGYPVVSTRDESGVELDLTITAKVTPGQMPVINMSLGAEANLQYLGAADPIVVAQLAASNTHLLVVAAGNTFAEPSHAWAQTDTVLSVGATEDKSGRIVATYSAIGNDDSKRTGPDVVAYGGSPELDGVVLPPDLQTPGTSYATPRVSQLAIFCQAAVAQLHRIWANVQGEPDLGVPLIGMGVIDLNRKNLPPLRLDIPGLPMTGVHESELVPVFQNLAKNGVKFRFAISPAALKQAIIDSAKELNGYDQQEAGHGFVCLEGVIQWLEDLKLSDVLRRWTSISQELISDLPDLHPFDKDGLRSLSKAVFNSRPVWVYDLADSATPFVCNGASPISQFEAATGQARLSLNQSCGHADAVVWTRPT